MTAETGSGGRDRGRELTGYCVYLVPYRDGEKTACTCGYCKYADIVAREHRHVDQDGRDYTGELRVIEMERQSPQKGDWGMLVGGEYHLELLTRKEAVSALRFVKRQQSCHENAYEISPSRQSPITCTRNDGS